MIANASMAEEASMDDGMLYAERSMSMDQSAPPSPMKAKRSAIMSKEGVEAKKAAPADQGKAPESQPQKRRPILIYKANLGLAVFRTQENLDTIEKMAIEAGGYLVRRGGNNIQVRVPAPDFEKTVEAIVELGDVHRREITAQDVTAEYTDLTIRLKNAEEVRERLAALLKTAVNVEEALKVEAELGRVAGQIELIKGRLKLLSELSAYSTITVEFTERTAQIKSRVELPFHWLNELGLNHLLSL
jgi:hypothetical protein